MARLLGAQVWVRAHVSETRRMFANDTGLPEALLDHGYSPRLVEQVDVSLAPARVARVRRKYEHLLAHGFLERGFDIEAMIDDGPLTRGHRRHAA